MRAPIYRHVEGRSTIAGLSLNGFIAMLAVALAAIQLLPLGSSLLAIAGSYFVLRLAGSGKPPMYWQHLAVWELRRLASAGRLSAAARSRAPQFPFGPYHSWDVRRSKPFRTSIHSAPRI